jgi:hypothetical protein
VRRVEVGLELVESAVELLAKRHAVELVEHGLVEALADPVGLRAAALVLVWSLSSSAK